AAGLLLLSFVAYQLWGTGIAEGRAQNAMATQFVQPQPALPTFGGLVGRITIPSIGVSKYLVAGVRLKDLERGPGLFPGSPLPGQKGNVAIAGHRTTYGAPFSRIDEIHDKAIITLESRDGPRSTPQLHRYWQLHSPLTQQSQNRKKTVGFMTPQHGPPCSFLDSL
ncbi:MAG: class E sortase, partial [Actinobacteria bacterium]|nr:class E sortase [Actinomycetota bacterium]